MVKSDDLPPCNFDEPGDAKLNQKHHKRRVRERAKNGEVTFPTSVPLSEDVRDLLVKLLCPKPELLISVREIEGSSPLDLSFNDSAVLRDNEPGFWKRCAHVLKEAEVLLAQLYQ